MQCPYLEEGHCKVSEFIAIEELRIKLPCPVTEDRCKTCQEQGRPDLAHPTLTILDNVRLVCPTTHKVKWVAAATRLRFSPQNRSKKSKKEKRKEVPKPPGVGTVIARLLKERHKVTPAASCQCDSLIAYYNNQGVAWCENNAKTIAKGLLKAAKKQAGVHNFLPDWMNMMYLKSLVYDAIRIVKEWTPPADQP